MIIDCISDLHGFKPKLEGGDLLIVAGDHTARDDIQGLFDFSQWIKKQSYKKIIVIAGNHDNSFESYNPKDPPACINTLRNLCDVEYLCDSGTEFEGFKIWGSPWTAQFPGINKNCCAFTIPFNDETEHWLAWQWRAIPSDIDILITHCPPYGILDGVPMDDGSLFHTGSRSLFKKAQSLPNLKAFIFGHIHEAYGMYKPSDFIKLVEDNEKVMGPPTCKSMPYIINASHVNENYKPINKPIRIIL